MEKIIFLTGLSQSLSLSKITLHSHIDLLYGIMHFGVKVCKLVRSGLSGIVFLPEERRGKINKLFTLGVNSIDI